jgi:hypothetical protein
MTHTRTEVNSRHRNSAKKAWLMLSRSGRNDLSWEGFREKMTPE